ncbi:endolytic transglycosylase MltG [Geodermatophilus sp. YIM 151500]|uniref:endolytic transglycosylase MltG n=1 Tax=Geodermatophilus sp. YIM 151500 TaxID=2984531 RepID=UPI0021E45925|nr:endolytic transglycosylase MltG [Geodermatophilus sp. YIM 151500]MCV2491453.1 endolytic transglycosylase MltG [Geodermatophilus sp. YIM 151500]
MIPTAPSPRAGDRAVPPSARGGRPSAGLPPVPRPDTRRPRTASAPSGPALRRAPDPADATGPLDEVAPWRYPGDRRPAPTDPADDGHGFLPGRHPSAPLPPRPAGTWERWARAAAAGRAGDGSDDGSDDAPTEVRPLVEHPDEAPADPGWQDSTGGLDVIGDHVDDGSARGGDGRGRSAASAGDAAGEEWGDDPGHPADRYDDAIPDLDGPAPRRRRRGRPLGVLVSLLVLAGAVAGIVLGGRALLEVVNPTAEDYTGSGSGSVEVRVGSGDTLSDIAGTLVDTGVIASAEPFVDAAEADPAALGIQPGTYTLRSRMSGQAALDLLLDPASRMLSRVTLPEGLTVGQTLQRLADATGRPLEEFTAAAADPSALGVPAYAGGQLEGYLFPATYDFEPDDAPVDMLRAMVAKFTEVAGQLQLEQRAAALGRTPGEIVTVASMIQSETRLDAERPAVAQVVYNRLARGMPLGIDATLAYGLQKNGNELTRADLQTDSPYNTRTRTGLPPTPISAPGEASLEAALAPSTGDLLYYVLQSADGTHFFTADYAEFEAARQRCADAGLGCGG